MKIGIISDTHDRMTGIDMAMKFFSAQKVEAIVHCGDWKLLQTMQYFAEHAQRLSLPIYGVLGNNDLAVEDFMAYGANTPNLFIHQGVAEYMFDNRSVAIYHGHHSPTLRKIVADEKYEIVLLGHSHKPRIEVSTNKIIINPGSTAFSIPRSKLWQPTVAILNTDTLDATLHTLSMDS